MSYHSLAPEAPPVLQPQDAAACLITHGTLGTDREVAFQPLVRHCNLKVQNNIYFLSGIFLAAHLSISCFSLCVLLFSFLSRNSDICCFATGLCGNNKVSRRSFFCKRSFEISLLGSLFWRQNN